MRSIAVPTLLTLPALAAATTLADICTTSYIASKLPADNFLDGVTPSGITFDKSSITAATVINGTSAAGSGGDTTANTFNYCNVTVAYSHAGRTKDHVQVMYGLPDPAKFKNRWLSTGGGGFAINSGSAGLTSGQEYGAASGATDGGFGSFSTQLDAVFLLANGTVNWQALNMFGYQAIHEMTIIGQALTRNVYSVASSQKLYSYYSGCSEGGREGWSQVQRFGSQFDGAAIGAPAFRFAFQQTNHLWPNVVERALDYYPPPCEFAEIVNATIAACDPLDGKTDGVVSRSDLCLLNFDMNTIVGKAYNCAATTAGGGMGGKAPGKVKRQMSTAAAPAQNGTVTQQAVDVARTIIEGLKDSDGNQVYFSYQIASAFGDAATKYDSTTGEWGLSVQSMGSEWVTRFVQLINTTSTLAPESLTADQLKSWIIEALQTYSATLETTWPDLTPFQQNGGKVLHYHGEADSSIPAASSVRYHEAVRSIMYPNSTYKEGSAALSEWYKLFIIPGAEHCGANSLQPNGPFPTTVLETVIEWVENNTTLTTLNGTVTQGTNKGQVEQICGWPLRPLWTNGVMDCVYDQTSIDSWMYDLSGVKVPVY